MHTEIYQSDPFTAQKEQLLTTLDTPYRFEVKDELFLRSGGRRIKVRVLAVRIDIDEGAMRRELLVLKL